MKIASIVRFEILCNAKKAYTYIFFGLLVFQGVWYTIGFSKIVANNNVLLNAPAINYQNLASMGMLLFAVTAIISAGALARDLESGAAHILYPAVTHEKRYFCGKYIGGVLVNLAMVLGYPLGILLFPLLGTGAPEHFGLACARFLPTHHAESVNLGTKLIIDVPGTGRPFLRLTAEQRTFKKRHYMFQCRKSGHRIILTC